ncbi:MAG: class I SAM-dependent methyltransferase [Alphaproteobacteria bacterium]|nr:class I SAM-dependent methyltransferase [Alphaproteobacteria bacterium]
MDGKAEAVKTWSTNPTGWTSAKEFDPGSLEFFVKANKFRDEEEQPWLTEVVPFVSMSGARVLEIGFGPGFDAYKFLSNGAVYSGIDLTPENVVRTKKHLAYFDLVPDARIGDAEALDFQSETFDIVYSNGVLHHVPDMAKAFKEANRVLKKNGRFYVILYHRNSVFYRLSMQAMHYLKGGFLRESVADKLSRIESTGAGAAPIVNVYSRKELATLLSQTGFSVTSMNVRKCGWDDLPGASVLGPLYRVIPKGAYSALGRMFGWYVIAEATKT